MSDGTTSRKFVPAKKVLERYAISDMTLWRWLAESSMKFPRPIYISRRRYWLESELTDWEKSQAESVA